MDEMKALRRNDRRDVDPYELKLIRVGHALWAQWMRDRGAKWGSVGEGGPLYAALETIWRLKREYRAELAEERRQRASSPEQQARLAKLKRAA
jgi:hypothetical protein